MSFFLALQKVLTFNIYNHFPPNFQAIKHIINKPQITLQYNFLILKKKQSFQRTGSNPTFHPIKIYIFFQNKENPLR